MNRTYSRAALLLNLLSRNASKRPDGKPPPSPTRRRRPHLRSRWLRALPGFSSVSCRISPPRLITSAMGGKIDENGTQNQLRFHEVQLKSRLQYSHSLLDVVLKMIRIQVQVSSLPCDGSNAWDLKFLLLFPLRKSESLHTLIQPLPSFLPIFTA